MNIDVEKTAIPGCYEIIMPKFTDNRGLFVKSFHEEVSRKNGLVTHFAEEFYTVSYKGVLRGLHVQFPPFDLIKLVFCLSGRVLDAVVDLRLGSSTYGKFALFELSAEKSNMIYIPSGVAHGFYSMTDGAIMMYKVTAVYSPSHDSGILWNSAGIPWPDKSPIISQRDREFPSLANFSSPFTFSVGEMK